MTAGDGRTMPAPPILERCRAAGFALAGVCAARPTSYGEELRIWLEEGKHGEMAYLADRVDARIDPTSVLAGVRSIICVADRYDDGADDSPTCATQGRIARYARGEDYHRVMKRRLHSVCDALREAHPDGEFRACVDTAPILEREHAQRAGLGAVGKHTLVIERGVGSYLLLGEILTTLEIEPSAPAAPDPCGTCDRCIEACPTDAITPFSVDATRCISYLTIEHRSTIPVTLHEGMRDWIFGCDICQEVCPHACETSRTHSVERHPAYKPRRQAFDLLDVLGWTDDDRRNAFITSAMKRAKLGMMKRNALIVGGNAFESMTRDEQHRFTERVARLTMDVTQEDVVRTTARQIANRLGLDVNHRPTPEPPTS